MKSARRPQAPKARSWTARAVRDPNGPYRPVAIKNKTKNKRPKHSKINYDLE
jgi:hypothetical protein